jgi:hypothetical protein
MSEFLAYNGTKPLDDDVTLAVVQILDNPANGQKAGLPDENEATPAPGTMSNPAAPEPEPAVAEAPSSLLADLPGFAPPPAPSPEAAVEEYEEYEEEVVEEVPIDAAAGAAPALAPPSPPTPPPPTVAAPLPPPPPPAAPPADPEPKLPEPTMDPSQLVIVVDDASEGGEGEKK